MVSVVILPGLLSILRAVLGSQCSCYAFLTSGGHLWGHSELVVAIWGGLGLTFAA